MAGDKGFSALMQTPHPGEIPRRPGKTNQDLSLGITTRISTMQHHTVGGVGGGGGIYSFIIEI